MNRYSASKIKTFDSCKLKYKLQYIDNIKVDTEEQDSTLFGKLIHKAFEIYDPKKNNKKEIIKLTREYPLSDNYKQLLTSTYKHVLKFHNKYKKYPAQEELDLFYEYDEFSIKGYIDRLMEAKKFYICVDYKTSRVPTLKYHMFQLKFYNLLLYKVYNINPSKIRTMLYFPRPDKEEKIMFSKNQILHFEKELYNKVAEIESMTEWPAELSNLCGFCEYYNTKYCVKTYKDEELIL